MRTYCAAIETGAYRTETNGCWREQQSNCGHDHKSIRAAIRCLMSGNDWRFDYAGRIHDDRQYRVEEVD